MPDDRRIHRRLEKSQTVTNLTDCEYRVWTAYLLGADDFGVLLDHPMALQVRNDGLAGKREVAVRNALRRLVDVRLLQRFEAEGRVYLFQGDWQPWQKVIYPRLTTNPKPPLARCCRHTQWLLQLHPAGGKRGTWQAPAGFAWIANPYDLETDHSEKASEKDSQKHSEKDSENVSEKDSDAQLYVGVGKDQLGEKQDARVCGSDPPLPPARVTLVTGSGERPLEVSALPEQALADRAARFLERYPALYAKHRRGARYLVRPARDFTVALDLCRTWDDTRLDQLATIFLTTDHEFATNGSRTLGQFAALASWCDDRLAEHDAKRRPA